ncbi:hypothetical protein E2C06_21405 [Dankookia rubra]|uniref:Uncharacterized protein n=1 Tax=Dankookia rubra TaxID=1442381 RepID=A0A4R5QDB3_9PROT|nr:NAD(P)-dependent oxidoreductase [Dankookia rubra]TDH60599.1 hypothetical protein E2C06_21405 [Dankookia rubra]
MAEHGFGPDGGGGALGRHSRVERGARTVIFQNDMMTTDNVFSAGTRAGLARVVWPSSEAAHGLPFTHTPPRAAPVPESGYALAKILCGCMAEEMSP